MEALNDREESKRGISDRRIPGPMLELAPLAVILQRVANFFTFTEPVKRIVQFRHRDPAKSQRGKANYKGQKEQCKP